MSKNVYGVYPISGNIEGWLDEESQIQHFGKVFAPHGYMSSDVELKQFEIVVGEAAGALALYCVVKNVAPAGKVGSSNYISSVDIETYKQHKADAKAKAALKAELDALVKVQAEIDKYAPYEEANPLVAEKLNQLRALMGLKVSKAK